MAEYTRRERAILYARVSDPRQAEKYSLEAQRRAFEAECDRRGWESAGVFVEPGETAYTDELGKRPQFLRALEFAEAGRCDVFVVHTVDRFARNSRVQAEALHRLSRAEVGFVALVGNMDFTGPFGQAMLTTMGAWAQLESDIKSEHVRKGVAERRAQGLDHGVLPFGAMRGPDGYGVPDTRTQHDGTTNYELLLRILRMVVDGMSTRRVALALNEDGYRVIGRSKPRPWGAMTIQVVASNAYYLGLLPDGARGRHAEAWAGFPAELWHAARAAKDARFRRRRGVAAKARVGPLSGLARCAGCGGTLRVQANGVAPRLVCRRRNEGLNDCTQPSANASRYEAQVELLLADLHIPDDVGRLVLAHAPAPEPSVTVGRRGPDVAAQLERLRKLYQWGDITEEEYRAQRERLRTIEVPRPAPRRSEGSALELAAAYLRDLPALWRDATPAERNALARSLFTDVWIRDRSIVAVTPREAFAPFFETDLCLRSAHPPSPARRPPSRSRGGARAAPRRRDRPHPYGWSAVRAAGGCRPR